MTHATFSKGTYRHRRKGISPIIATIILIVITVAVGGLLYAYVGGMFGSMSTSQDVNIQNSLTMPAGASTGTWTVSVKNTGSVAITNMTAVLYSSSGSPIAVIYAGSYPMLTVPAGIPSGTYTASTVSPGQTVSGTAMSIPSSNVIAGTSYNYQLVVQFANGVQKTYTGAVTAETN
jgi:flagellin-like protein